MSGYAETVDCPRCGSDSLEHAVDGDDITGMCIDCGYEYHTVTSLMTLERVNEFREEVELEPLTELKPPLPDWKD